MLEEEKKATTTENPQNAEEYVEAINKLKENYVPKEQFEKSENDRKVLMNAILEGRKLELDGQPEEKPDIKALRKRLIDSGEEQLSNAEYVETVLKLRSAVIAEGGLDPFLPRGAKVKPTLEDIKGAARVAEGLQYCLDESRDEETGKLDNEIFNAHLKKIIADDSPILTARLRTKARKK